MLTIICVFSKSWLLFSRLISLSHVMLFDSISPTVELLSRWKSTLSNPAAASSTQFMWYSKSFVVISTIFRASLSGVDAISDFAHSQEATLHPLKFYDEITASKPHFQIPLLILVLLLFLPHLKLLFSLKSWTPQSIQESWSQLLTNSYSCWYFDIFLWIANILNGI